MFYNSGRWNNQNPSQSRYIPPATENPKLYHPGNTSHASLASSSSLRNTASQNVHGGNNQPGTMFPQNNFSGYSPDKDKLASSGMNPRPSLQIYSPSRHPYFTESSREEAMYNPQRYVPRYEATNINAGQVPGQYQLQHRQMSPAPPRPGMISPMRSHYQNTAQPRQSPLYSSSMTSASPYFNRQSINSQRQVHPNEAFNYRQTVPNATQFGSPPFEKNPSYSSNVQLNFPQNQAHMMSPQSRRMSANQSTYAGTPNVFQNGMNHLSATNPSFSARLSHPHEWSNQQMQGVVKSQIIPYPAPPKPQQGTYRNSLDINQGKPENVGSNPLDIDSLLEVPLETGGSFLQQLEDVVPSEQNIDVKKNVDRKQTNVKQPSDNALLTQTLVNTDSSSDNTCDGVHPCMTTNYSVSSCKASPMPSISSPFSPITINSRTMTSPLKSRIPHAPTPEGLGSSRPYGVVRPRTQSEASSVPKPAWMSHQPVQFNAPQVPLRQPGYSMQSSPNKYQGEVPQSSAHVSPNRLPTPNLPQTSPMSHSSPNRHTGLGPQLCINAQISPKQPSLPVSINNSDQAHRSRANSNTINKPALGMSVTEMTSNEQYRSMPAISTSSFSAPLNPLSNVSDQQQQRLPAPFSPISQLGPTESVLGVDVTQDNVAGPMSTDKINNTLIRNDQTPSSMSISTGQSQTSVPLNSDSYPISVAQCSNDQPAVTSQSASDTESIEGQHIIPISESGFDKLLSPVPKPPVVDTSDSAAQLSIDANGDLRPAALPKIDSTTGRESEITSCFEITSNADLNHCDPSSQFDVKANRSMNVDFDQSAHITISCQVQQRNSPIRTLTTASQSFGPKSQPKVQQSKLFEIQRNDPHGQQPMFSSDSQRNQLQTNIEPGQSVATQAAVETRHPVPPPNRLPTPMPQFGQNSHIKQLHSQHLAQTPGPISQYGQNAISGINHTGTASHSSSITGLHQHCGPIQHPPAMQSHRPMAPRGSIEHPSGNQRGTVPHPSPSQHHGPFPHPNQIHTGPHSVQISRPGQNQYPGQIHGTGPHPGQHPGPGPMLHPGPNQQPVSVKHPAGVATPGYHHPHHYSQSNFYQGRNFQHAQQMPLQPPNMPMGRHQFPESSQHPYQYRQQVAQRYPPNLRSYPPIPHPRPEFAGPLLSPQKRNADRGVNDAKSKKSKTSDLFGGKKKNSQAFKAGDKKEDELDKDLIPGNIETANNTALNDTSEKPAKPKSKKKPPATFKSKKRKRKKADDSDEYDLNIPPSETEISDVNKRRSARNSKRKRYVENWDLSLPDELLEEEVASETSTFKEQHDAIRNDDAVKEKYIVEKILDMRIRRVKVEAKEQADSHLDAAEAGFAVQEETLKNEKNDTDMGVNPLDPIEKGKMEVKTEEEEKTDGKTKVIKAERKKSPVAEEEYVEVEEYFAKYKNYSYLHCDWKTKDEFEDKRIDGKIKRYRTKLASQRQQFIDPDLTEPFNPDFVEVERVLDVSVGMQADDKTEKHYFVKWCSLPYEDSTWEHENDVPTNKIAEFEERCKYRPPANPVNHPHKNSWQKLSPKDGMFKNDNELRDYQLEGLNWLLFNWHNRRNCILADEMGLGKTIQSITFLQKIFDHGIEGPFLVVAPLSTIGNWQREFAAWTTLNAIVYHGSQNSRDMIQTYEFQCRDEKLDEIMGAYKMHAVITTYEMIVLENSDLLDIEWKCLIIDEAHRLKNQSCKLADSLRTMELNFKVLLTGTPLQNNVEELFALLNFLQPEVFNSTEAFLAEFGDLKENSQVEKLQELLKPMMLRRLKEDVEKSLAPKEETIIEVELTDIQKKYYRAILERNFEFLAKGSTSGNVPNLMNTMMELRKCCNHPYLIKGAEDKIHSEAEQLSIDGLSLMIQSSGKLVLLDKLLPKLKSGGHKVLIFSQMVRCLDILEDYLVQKSYLYERIDGCVRGNERQMAIDRFSKPVSDRFVFLLCTRAGGLGINLTAADTVIIFDSDWNPQNDLQAQARCHRIGQRNTVKIYRLITRNSYEREMFDKASLKLGLDKAVLQSISGRQNQVNQNTAPSLSKKEVEDLLKRGAYGAIMDENDESKNFCEEDIDQILQRRAHTVTIAAGEKGSTFSKASFISGEQTDISLDDPNFWEKWAKKADLDVENMTGKTKLIIEEPRRRKQTKRFGGMPNDAEVFAELGSDSDSDYEEKQTSSRQRKKCKTTKNWSKKDYFRIQKSLLTFGWGRWEYMLSRGRYPSYIKLDDIELVSRALLIYCLKYYNGDEKIKVFIWDLITPTEHAIDSALLNHEGLASPVPRGRKGRRAKDESSGNWKDEKVEREWVKEINVETILLDDGFKKHLQHHCNKIVLRTRMLYYLHTEILGSVTKKIDETEVGKLDLKIPNLLPDNLPVIWDSECDKNLLFGVFKHGYEKYSSIRADPKLCFLGKFGMPDNKALADETDFDAEDEKDPEYKPTRVNFTDISEFEDSPMSASCATAPTSPASLDNGSTEQKPRDEEASKAEEKKSKESVKKDVQPKTSWPAVSELNLRIRRIISSHQKQKQVQARLSNNLEQDLIKLRAKENNLRDKKEFQTHWTRREEADFYRTVSTFGVKYDEKGGFTWTHFRNLAKLDKKSDASLQAYFLSFKSMCEEVCGQKTPSKERGRVPVAHITEERASRTLQRLQLLDCIRLEVLCHDKLDEHLKLCERNLDLPTWWKPGIHDKQLLIGMDRHGVTRTEIHILNDSSLPFLQSLHEFEIRESNQRSNRKRKVEKMSYPSVLSFEASSKSIEVKSESMNKNKAELPGDSEVKTDQFTPIIKEDMADQVDRKEIKSVTAEEAAKESWKKVTEEIPYNISLYAYKWPKDRTLIQHAEHLCYCVRHGKWPSQRFQDNVLPTKVNVSGSSTPINTKVDNPASRFQRDGISKDASLLLEAYSQLQAYNLQNTQAKRENTPGEMLLSQKKESRKAIDDIKSVQSSEVLDLQFLNNQFNQTLQSLLKSVKNVPKSPQTSAMRESSTKEGEMIRKREKDKEEKRQPEAGKVKAETLEKHSLKKKNQKPKIGFISPAVLPSHARIPVHNPTKKEKLTGERAPLNKDLADWLKQHPGFVVDYKSLREKLDEDDPSLKVTGKKENRMSASPASESSKSSENLSKTSSRKCAIPNVDKKPSTPVQYKDMDPSWANMPYGLMESMYGLTPEMAALMMSGMFPLPMSQLVHQPSLTARRKEEKPASGSSYQEKSSHQKSESVKQKDELAALSALFPKSNFMSSDPYQFMNMFQLSMGQFESPKSNLAANSLAPFFAGMPAAMNPLFAGVFPQTDLPSATSALLAKDLLKLEEQENSDKLLSQLAMTNPEFSSSVLDFNNTELQKYWLSEQLLQAQIQALQAASLKPSRQLNDSMQNLYSQMYSSLLTKENSEVKKDEKRSHSDSRTMPSPTKDEPMNLSSKLK